MTSLDPYPMYQESEIDWLSRVPSHWTLRSLRSLLIDTVAGYWGDEPAEENQEDRIRCIRVADFDVSRLAVSDRKSTYRAIPSVHRHKRLLGPGDILLEKSGGGDNQPVGRVVRFDSHEPAITSNFVTRLRAKSEVVDTLFLVYLMDHLQRIRITILSIKQTTGIQNLDERHYLSNTVAVPPLDEQRPIADFLDGMDARITRFIAARRKMIALLEEKKQAVINQAVTRGLDPDVPMKDCGVHWLGEVPAHWEVRRLKDFLREVDERSATGAEELLSVSHLTGVTPRSEKNITMFKAESYVGHKLCRPGDIVANTMWLWMGAIGTADHTGIISSSYAVYRLTSAGEMNLDYLDSLLRSRRYVSEYRRLSTGIRSSRLRLYPEQFLRLQIAAPQLTEQDAILDHIHRETFRIDTLITRHRREIELIQEYRTRLISDIVTGKLDVRGVKLPAVKEIIGEKIVQALEDGESEALVEAMSGKE